MPWSILLGVVIIAVIAGGVYAYSTRKAEPPTKLAAHVLTSNPEASAYYKKGMDALTAGDTSGATAAFEAAVKAADNSALTHAGLSRAYLRGNRTEEAVKELKRAEELMAEADDLDRRFVYAWSWHMKGLAAKTPEDRAKAFEKERSTLDYALVMYPDEVSVWLARGDAADDVHKAPFHLTVLRMKPDHPLGKVWKNVVPPQPDVKVKPGRPVGPPPQVPLLFEGIGNLSHKITTKSDLAQKYYEQGLRCFHCYVTPSRVKNGAARSFQYAITLDPQCAMAYWGLSFCLERGDGMMPMEAARNALALAKTDREQRYAKARILELSGPKYRNMFFEALDGAIAAYPDDPELWIWRGKVYGDYGASGEEQTLGAKVLSGMAFILAAKQLAPNHPSPNHELIHQYEAINRPELGWQYALPFRAAAPNMPHAHHMRAHLAMRLGRWDDALEATAGAYKMSQAGFPELDPGHHLFVYLLTLAHEGKFNEIYQTLAGAKQNIAWALMLRLKADPEGLREWVNDHKGAADTDALYVTVLVALNEGKVDEARKAMETLKASGAPMSKYRAAELNARWKIANGQVDEGMDLFEKTAWDSVQDGSIHFFGGGGYFPEAWGEQCLRLGRLDDAEFAFHEALAHEHGSIVATLGMQVVWERRNRPDLAKHYADRAAELWKNADKGALDRQLERMRGFATQTVGAK